MYHWKCQVYKSVKNEGSVNVCVMWIHKKCTLTVQTLNGSKLEQEGEMKNR